MRRAPNYITTITALSFLVCLLTAFSTFLSETETPQRGEADIPTWALENMAHAVGRRVTDNAAYQSENEPFDAYGMEWAWSIGEKSIEGRLFGLQEDKEIGPFWEFKVFWHPGEEKLKIYQFGSNGTVGIGSIEHKGGHKTEALQTFYNPDGTQSMIGHREEVIEGATHTASFDVDANGVWTPRRSYVWHRVDS